MFAVKVQGGKARIHNAKTGAFQRVVGSNVVSAQVLGDLVQVTDNRGKVSIFDAKTGAFKRSLY